jgi:hypothetical protein
LPQITFSADFGTYPRNFKCVPVLLQPEVNPAPRC